ncbi:MAG: hypothetical protein HRU13_03890 [Phycisphaerales bacterium]|nr:hypothetical protein [Phycisphaerales bacterium]
MAAIFGKKQTSENKVDGSPSAVEALRDAFERNCPAGFARLGHVGQDPLATGRLLKWGDKGLEVEELQVIGGEIRFGIGDRLECYATIGEDVIAFGAKVLDMARPQRLNESTVVRSIKLQGPTGVEFGNRRAGYRAQLSVLGGEYEGDVWFLDRWAGEFDPRSTIAEDPNPLFTSIRAAARMSSLYPPPSEEAIAEYYGTPLPAQLDEDGNPIANEESALPAPEQAETPSDIALRWRTLVPSDAVDWPSIIRAAQETRPHARVRIADISPSGIGMTMYGVSAMQLQRFERLVLSTTIEDHAIQVVGAIRRSEELTQRRCRVGIVLVHPGPSQLHAEARKSLEAINLMVQRELLKRRDPKP